MNDQTYVAMGRIKRQGIIYERGADMPADFGLARGDQYLIDSEQVIPREVYEARAAQTAQDKYMRDILHPAQNVASRAARDLTHAQAALDAATAALHGAKAAVKDAKQAHVEAARALADAEKGMPA